jgi:hypothetical protein
MQDYFRIDVALEEGTACYYIRKEVRTKALQDIYKGNRFSEITATQYSDVVIINNTVTKSMLDLKTVIDSYLKKETKHEHDYPNFPERRL